MDSIQIASPFGEITVSAYAGKISALYFSKFRKNVRLPRLPQLEKVYGKDDSQKNTQALKQAKQQIKEYSQGKRQTFDLPLAFEGTSFQEKVWKNLTKIPYGKTISYAELAKRVKSPNAFRAAGSANGKNAISIIIPCHRVIASNGSISGYAGGPKTKALLLEHEQATV